MSSFIDCILNNIKKGLLTESDGQTLVSDFDRLKKKNSDAGAISKLEDQMLEQQMRQKANFLRHMRKRDEYFTKMNARKTTTDKIRFNHEQMQAARDMGAVTYERTVAVFNETLKDLDLGKIDEGQFKQAAIAVMNGTEPKDPAVKAVAQSLRNVFKYAKNEADTYGLIFGDLGEKYFPRFYEKTKFRTIRDDDEWVRLTKEYFDFGDASDAEVREILIDFKKDVETDGLHSMSKEETIAQGLDQSGNKNFATKRNKSRELKYKSGEAYVAFNEKFGNGDIGLMEHFQKYMMSVSNDLGVAKTLGPMPRSLVDEAELRLKAEAATGNAGALESGWNSTGIKSIRGEFEVLMGQAFTGDRDFWGNKMFSASQNLMRASQLGSAQISALSDPAFGVIANKLNGGKFLQPIIDYLGTITHLVGNKTAVQGIVDDVGYLVEGFNGMMIGDTRMSLGGEGQGAAKWLATKVFQASGLDRWTKNGRAIAKVNANNTIAQMMSEKLAWADLPDVLRANLERAGLTPDDWALAAQHLEIRDLKGRPYIRTNDLRLNQELGYAKGSDIADRIDLFVEQTKNIAINENNLKTEAWTSGANFSGSGSVGGVGKAGAAAFFQYKSFTLAVVNNHLIPAIRRAHEGIKEGNVSKLDHLAMLTIGTTLAASIPLQLKEIIKGRNPKDMQDPKFWMAAMLQGGGLGIFGDFFFKDYSRAGSFGATLIGPYGSTVEGLVKVASGSVSAQLADEDESAKSHSSAERRKLEAFRMLKKNIPGNNLWYTRLATERLIFDNLERLIDPKFDKRQRKLEKRLTEEREGDAPYWWGPSGGPDPEKIIAPKRSN